ncbi:YacL family protein [Shewanella sp. AS16]|uniref:YacL family protein n=1 Tax=Shewanella sp. AS16 TaxID=2907625 RepID=UPI001F3106FE|nr:YacL family protein [Shewanella sp. AS16]MCE9685535.1 YacL family protein [Shewanella sp. AS16]
MEYEFRRNSLDGTAIARFSMDHEALGQWFSEELANNSQSYEQICGAMAQLRSGKLNNWRLVGADLTLELDREQARVYANVLGFDEEHDLDESMSLYDAESESYCGLEDFEQALLSWHKFLNRHGE